ncbi:two-component system sensor histidine kinase VicK [Arcticibacter tournemirensis]|uniref:histidine kinase n=1 Tax=Arcticibacter tournemirensis TaxID=699437 RepID=A0A5M9HG00_9SPHI|nr:ATP-binding protein [Arcticibacter tournemirensis]KAA8485315.1 GHKL domain-containing protein [Arcticibacter tournemirensis]TQM50400.1 two-component system sensor histidine kinase VicK [Arcticibacter tournemirensis]
MTDRVFQSLAEHSPNVNFAFDLTSGRFKYVNQAFRQLFNAEDEALTLDYVRSKISAADREYLRKCLVDLMEGVVYRTIEFRIEPGLEERWIRLSPFVLKSDSGTTIIGNATDITDEIVNINTLKKYTNKKNSVLNILAHDLRGSLGIANTLTQALTKEVTDPKLSNFIQIITKILKQSTDLITDLTQREFFETAEVDLVTQRVDIAAKLKEVMDEYRKSEWTTERIFNFSSSNESIFLELDDSKFMQVVNNLMTNALKFTKKQGVISLTVTDQKDSVLFTFSDDGIGIPEKCHAVLFEKFTEARRKGLNGEPTVGLGLSIVKMIVEWHKGRIWFESKENAGTTFYVEIPRN